MKTVATGIPAPQIVDFGQRFASASFHETTLALLLSRFRSINVRSVPAVGA
jgi:hypothetical protein